ncbi:MAG: hypothetical protein ACYCOO_00955, partial [Chitinophagaceae bacterium]
KVPISLPYLNDSKDYEPARGEIFYQGQHYNAVKKRLFHDTLYTVYFRDSYKNQLYKKVNEIVGCMAHTPSSYSKDAHIWDNLIKEYLPKDANPVGPWLISFHNSYSAHLTFFLPAVSLPFSGPPPKFIA